MVYDVTLFLTRHPGGKRIILKQAGNDCSEDFGFHSSAAHEIWRKYQIGTLLTSHGSTADERWGRLAPRPCLPSLGSDL